MRWTFTIVVLVLASTPAIAQQGSPGSTTSVVKTLPKAGNLGQSLKAVPSPTQEGDMLQLQNKQAEKQQAIELLKKLNESQGQGCEICKNIGK